MPTRLIRILQLLISLLLPLLFVFGTVRLLVTDGYLAYEYAKAGFPPDPFGLDRGQRLALASDNFRYVRERQPLDALASQRLAGQLVYNARELKHMQDVQDVFQAGWLAWKAGLLAIVLSAVVLGWTAATRPALAAAVKAGGLITTGLVGAAGLLAVLAWQVWFVAFHQIFFAAGTWTFEYTDTLIRLFPEKFWFDAALAVSGLSVAGGLAGALAGWRLQRRRAVKLPALPSHRLVYRSVGMSATKVSAIKSRETRQAARQRALARQKRIRAVVFGVIAVGVLIAAGSLLYSAFSRPKLEALAGNVIEVTADMSGFDTKLIRVKVGQAVTIRLTSLDNSHHTDGGGKHQWAVDELGANVIAQPESSNTVTFTPETRGTFTYYCDICCGGRANPSMQGTLVVEG